MTELMIRPQTREQWLELAILKLRPLFAEQDIHLPAVRVSVGWPSRGGTANKGKVIGQCWKSTVATDGVAQIFISPILGHDRDEVVKMLGVLVHELIHAVDDCVSGHKGAFAQMAKRMGLTGKMTATTVGEDLAGLLSGVIDEVGEYPHAVLRFEEMERQRSKQTTRMLKVVCPDDDYTIRTTQKWIDMGLPTCPCGTEMELA
jgi:hypothetical protein